ncbi:hypothetical protein ACIPJK_23755 [Streptomyces roseus]|uniref:hypothetical protein n=1 Tax=Streptomyces roseus TaxID=66430 RepID=UPI00382C70B6
MTTTTAAQHLRTIATEWPRLTDALDPRGTNWLASRADLFRTLDEADAAEALAYRLGHRTVLDRSPEQLGATRPPLSIRVHDTRRTIEVALAGCADVIASRVQVEPIPYPGLDWPTDDLARRAARSRADVADPRRWRYRGRTPSAPHTALWLLARVERRPGPFRTLTAADERYIRSVAGEAVNRMEAVLGLAVVTEEADRPCPDCGGLLIVRTEAGDPPTARCKQCGRVWTLTEPLAA